MKTELPKVLIIVDDHGNVDWTADGDVEVDIIDEVDLKRGAYDRENLKLVLYTWEEYGWKDLFPEYLWDDIVAYVNTGEIP